MMVHKIRLENCEHLDSARFEDLRLLQEDGKPRVLGLIADRFVAEATQCLAETVAAGADPSALTCAAHSLKDLCGTIGAIAMRARAVDLEEAVRDGRLGAIGTIIRGLHAELCHIERLLNAYTHDHQHAGVCATPE
jgi:HPt (histidine-containing phosphotransfer) domain-containing protein